MNKLIHLPTKKNIALTRKILSNRKVTISWTKEGHPRENVMTGASALMLCMDRVSKGLFSEALEQSKFLIDEFPTIIDPYLLKLQVLIKMELLVDAKNLLKWLEKEAPNNLGVLTHSISLLALLNRQGHEVMRALHKALARYPNDRNLLFSLGLLLEQSGKRKKAVKIYSKLLVLSFTVKDFEIYQAALFQITGIKALSKDQLCKLNLILNQQFSLDESFSVYFSLASSAYKQGNREAEKKWLDIANNKMKKFEISIGRTWDLDTIFERRERLQVMFEKQSFNNFEQLKKNQHYMPILVVAMPRSGTTLLEQILGSHPSIGQTGESNSFNLALQSKNIHGSFPESLLRMNIKDWEEISSMYLEHELLLTDNPIFVNKNLANHLHVGLVANLFSRSKFIHLLRNPLDNCLSIYQNRILNATYSTSLKNTIEARSEHNKLSEYWKKLYPDRFYTIQYEDLVTDGERIIRDLLEFLGVGWDESLLEFDKRDNFVRTPSVNQVRKELNSSAVNKWLEYKDILKDVLDVEI